MVQHKTMKRGDWTKRLGSRVGSKSRSCMGRERAQLPTNDKKRTGTGGPTTKSDPKEPGYHVLSDQGESGMLYAGKMGQPDSNHGRVWILSTG